ncbi:MAG: DUF1501 domain-containing protein [Verrucomicrobia bacterium]|nr:DUF1501 domain-containing protein [Verrucomicrobiota bacterium]
MSYTRRDFLKDSFRAAGLLSLAGSAPRFLVNTAMAAASQRRGGDTVLVVLELSGGNDGLNTVIPYADDVYHRSRPTLRQVASKALKIDDHIGFHPRMGGFSRLHKDGLLTVVQGVGCPDSDKNHPGAKRAWHTAETKTPGPQTGWLGRAADQLFDPAAANVPAAFVGKIMPLQATNAERVVVPALRSAVEMACRGSEAKGLAPEAGDDPLLASVRRATAETIENSRRIERAIAATNTADYPQLVLAQELRIVAQLIRADVGIRIFYTELGGGNIGGFDNHAGQLGNHCALLQQISDSLTAFTRDLQRDKLLDRVVLMTVSEFGRTLQENGRRGTNHGVAAPTFLVGGKLKGGVVGAHPSLTDVDKDSSLHLHTDFRALYATVLDGWLGVDSRAVLGASFKPLDVLAG